jgi:hypothetical protein
MQVTLTNDLVVRESEVEAKLAEARALHMEFATERSAIAKERSELEADRKRLDAAHQRARSQLDWEAEATRSRIASAAAAAVAVAAPKQPLCAPSRRAPKRPAGAEMKNMILGWNRAVAELGADGGNDHKVADVWTREDRVPRSVHVNRHGSISLSTSSGGQGIYSDPR